jgi:hypothetical protein
MDMGKGDIKSTSEEKNHWVEFDIRDPKGKSLSGKKYILVLPDGAEEEGILGSDGKVRKEGIPPGQCQILFEGLHNARWSTSQIVCGERVELIASTVFCKEGSQVKFEIYRDGKKKNSKAVKTLYATVEGKTAHVEWRYQYEDQDMGRYPQFLFEATHGEHRATSNSLQVGDEIEAQLSDEEGNPLIHAPYVLLASNGDERIGNSDEKGCIREKILPLGKCKIRMKEGEKLSSKS